MTEDTQPLQQLLKKCQKQQQSSMVSYAASVADTMENLLNQAMLNVTVIQLAPVSAQANTTVDMNGLCSHFHLKGYSTPK